jgi:hypothetical protein
VSLSALDFGEVVSVWTVSPLEAVLAWSPESKAWG